MYKIVFASPRETNGPTDSFCPICGGKDSRPILTVKATGHLPDDLDLVECGSCGTMYFLGDDPVLGYDFAGFSQDYWYRYVQNGAGISAMLEPLLAIGGPRRGDLLDIGCGFGFVPDFWQRSGFGQAVGLETSTYGKVGREKLGVEIIASYYNDAREIAGRKFDYVYSSEVLEHVRDPYSFIMEISEALAPEGVLVLSTPCADGISPATDIPTISGILSPGFHYFITRPQALETLLRSCGFRHVLVRNSNNRLFCWASHCPLPEIKKGFQDWDIYLSYLEMLARNSDPHVSCGALYRLLKDSINLGRNKIARRAYQDFELLAKSTYGIDFRSPSQSPDRDQERRPGTAEWPSWLGCGYLFAGRYHELENAPAPQLVKLYSAAIDAMQQEIEEDTPFAQEAFHFLPMARQHLSKALAAVPDAVKGLGSGGYPVEFVRNSKVDFRGKEVCLFVTYVPGDRLLPGARAMAEALMASGLTVVVCCAVEDMNLRLDHSGLDGAVLIIKRKNGGYDFAAWAAILSEIPELWSAERLFFVNDSILGPMGGLDQVLSRIRASGADFLALTESYEIRHHSQSYFFVFQKEGMRSPEVRNFWRGVRVEKKKMDVIEKYEVNLLSYARDVAGLGVEVLFSFDYLFSGSDYSNFKKVNPTHSLWEHLLHFGFPFVKAELLHANPLGINIDHWEQIVTLCGGNVSIFREHLMMMIETRGVPVARDRNRKWNWIRRVLGDELFFELREAWTRTRGPRR